MARSDGNISVGYDGLGRRSFDYQAVASPTGQTQSRRDYSYLPSGQLGQIQGQTAAGELYTVALRYDAEGRPGTIAYSTGEAYELFWDDMDRLIAASIESGGRSIRWSYHYAGATMVAATREIAGDTTEVKRFWSVADERGLIYRMVDEEGATYWQAHWDATGWRSLDGTPQPDMWVPFGLDGQVIIEHTEASPGAGASSVRPALVLNQLRVYDPLFGSFLQPDPADQSVRLLPEGYLLARGDYLGQVDDPGGRSKIRDQYNKFIPPGWELRFDPSCADHQQQIQNAVDAALVDIDRCPFEKCGAVAFAAGLKRQWTFALLTGAVYCSNSSRPTLMAGGSYPEAVDGQIDGGYSRARAVTDHGMRTLGDRHSMFSSEAFGPKGCMERSVAHEALHGVFKTFPLKLVTFSDSVDKYGEPKSNGDLEHPYYNTQSGVWAWNKQGFDEDDKMAPFLSTCSTARENDMRCTFLVMLTSLVCCQSSRPDRVPPGPSPKFGTVHPLDLLRAGATGRWVVACQARQDTDGKPGITVTVMDNGARIGDRMVPYLIRGGGEGAPIDGFVAASNDGRWIVLVRRGELVLIDDKEGRELILPGGDPRGDSAIPRIMAAFDQHSAYLTYARWRGGNSAVVVRMLATGSEQEIAMNHEVWQVEQEPLTPWLRITQIDPRKRPASTDVPQLETEIPGGVRCRMSEVWGGQWLDRAWLRPDTQELTTRAPIEVERIDAMSIVDASFEQYLLIRTQSGHQIRNVRTGDAKELQLPGDVTAPAGPLVAVGSALVDLVAARVIGRYPQPPLAVDVHGRGLFAGSETTWFHPMVGPVQWLPAEPPAGAHDLP